MVAISHGTSFVDVYVLELNIIVMFCVVLWRLCADVASTDVVNVAAFARWQLTVSVTSLT